jgi:transcriptional regulator with XRE-family HTH domain
MPITKSKPIRSQFFTTALECLMERNGVNQVKLSAATGIAVSRVNNYLHGKYRTIRPDHLALIAKAAGQTPAERNELVRAYLLDLLPESLQGEIRIETGGEGAKPSKQTASEANLLPRTTRAALADLQGLSVRSAKARARMQWFAEIMREAHPA